MELAYKPINSDISIIGDSRRHTYIEPRPAIVPTVIECLSDHGIINISHGDVLDTTDNPTAFPCSADDFYDPVFGA